MTVRSRVIVGVATLALAAGCHPSRPKLPDLPAAFANLPAPPDAQFLGRSGGADVLVLTFSSPYSPDTVVAYYKKLFTTNALYHLLGDNRGATGEEAFYVETSNRPLWVRVRPNAGGLGSIVELTGAVVNQTDTAAKDSAAAKR